MIQKQAVSQPPLLTQWGKGLNPDAVLQEYPRPQLERDSYMNLNGRWQYAITDTENEPSAWDGDILVPFSPESVLSGVSRTLLPGQTLWYRRELVLPDGFQPEGYRVLLHFGAVDQDAVVYLNGEEAGRHIGGYTAFTLELTRYLQPTNILTVRVRDDTDTGGHGRGKQKLKRGGIWYTPQSGIWQTVWLEAVSEVYIEGLKMIPCCEKAELELTVLSVKDQPCEANVGGVSYPLRTNQPCAIPMRGFEYWSPEHPKLYPITITLGADKVNSYFAMRSTRVQTDANGVKRLFLNDRPYFHNGLLDQGYWPDGLYTAPSDAALCSDIETAKALGYNMLRKHIKVESMRWYYHCDRLGLLVWQDMVNGGGTYRFPTVSLPLFTNIHWKDKHYRLFAREDGAGRASYLREMEETVSQLRNSPCVALWVTFNEGWGQFDAKRVCERLLALDDTRPIDPASGWHDQRFGDLRSWHVYFKPFRFRPDRKGRAVALSEFGGYNLRENGHCLSDADFGYRRFPDESTLWAAYRELYDKEVIPAIRQGLCAAVYTQLTDVEDELNGVMTYDRRVVKLPREALKNLNREVEEWGAGRRKVL